MKHNEKFFTTKKFLKFQTTKILIYDNLHKTKSNFEYSIREHSNIVK